MPSDKPKQRWYVTWDDVELWTGAIVETIIAIDYKPSAILAIGSGGLIPAAMIAYKYTNITGKHPILEAAYASAYRGERHAGLTIHHMPDKRYQFATGRHCLIVDDIADSGETLGAFHHRLPQALTATLIYKQISCVVPNFWGHHDLAGDSVWYVFPWENG